MAQGLPPPPTNDQTGSFAWLEWFRQLRNYITQTGSVPWSIINFANSDLSDLQTRSHQNLQSLQGGTTGQYYHLTQAKKGTVDNLDLTGVSGTGIKIDTTSPTFGWKDLLGEVIPKYVGVGSPTLAVFRGGNVKSYAFAAGEDYDGSFHIPHDWVPGTDVYMHVHWAHNGTAISGSLVLDWYFTYAKGHAQAAFPAEITVTQTISTPNIATIPQYNHRIDEFQLSTAGGSSTMLNTTNLEPDGLILFHVTTSTIPTITGGSPNKPFLFTLDLHYQSTNLTTKNKVPNFYV